MSEKNVSRRSFLGIGVAAVVAGVVAGVGGYYAGALSAPPGGVTTTTLTAPPITSTVTAPGGGVSTVTTTVTAPPVTTTVTQPKTTTVTTTATGGPAPRTVKIGTVFGVTGGYAEICYKYAEWHEAWEKYTNEVDGGVYVREYGRKLPVEVIWYDDVSNTDKDVELIQKLITTDKVDILIGPWGSMNTLRASTVPEKEHVPMVGAEAAMLDLYTRGFQWFVGVTPYLPNWSELYFEMLKYYNSIGKTNFKTIAFLGDDSGFSDDIIYGSEQHAEAAGISVVGKERIPMFSKDFSPVVAKFKSLNPDIVYYANDGSPNLGLLKQSAELGLKPKQFHMCLIMWPEVIQEPSLYKNVTSETEFSKKTVDTKYGTVTTTGLGISDIYTIPYAYVRYRGFEVALRAIEDAGTLDPEKIREALWNMRWWGPGGWVMEPWGRVLRGKPVRGLLEKTQWTFQIQEGPQIQCVWPADMADKEYVPPGI